MTFDSSKPVQTRDGRKARLLCADLENVNCVVTAVQDKDGKERVYVYNMEGIGPHGSASYDLINIPEKPKWATIWKDGTCAITPKKPSKAILTAARACFEFIEGDGL